MGDPLSDKWNSYSPYNYVLNNPVSTIDPDGKDAIFTYDEKTKTITIAAKIYYQGKSLPSNKELREKLIGDINKDLKETYKDGTVEYNGEKYTVKFVVTA